MDYKGARYLIDALKEPNVPVIIIGENERVDETSNLVKPSYDKGLLNVSSELSKSRIACTMPYRQDAKTEVLKAMFMTVNVLSQVEGWTRGTPEIRVECWSPVNSTGYSSIQKIGGPGYYFEPNKRDDIKDKWWALPYQEPLFQWTRSVNTRNVIFFFWEWDGNGGSKTVTLAQSFKIPSQNGNPETTSNLTINTTIGGGGKEIVKPLIDQDICPDGTYNSWGTYGGEFKWAVIQQ